MTARLRLSRRRFNIALASLASVGVLAACGGDDDESGDRLKGDIIVDGSSTVFPITMAAAEEFSIMNTGVRVSVGVSGTGGGFKKFAAGETDITNASRPIKPSEAEAVTAAGLEYIELPVAYDGLTVVVNPENDWVDCLTVAELKKMWEPAAQRTITNWNQIRDGFPDLPLDLFAPGVDSGTFDYFTEAIVGEAQSSRGDFQASEDDNVLVTGVSGSRSAIGYFGLSYYVENTNKVRAVPIDAGNGACVDPTFESVADGSYQPLSRPIFIYVRKDAAERPEVDAFIKYFLSPEFTPLISSPEVGYVQLGDDVYAALTQRFANRITGTEWPNGAEVGASLKRYMQ
jgi:phosphate binding protein